MNWYMVIPYLSALAGILLLGGTLIFIPPNSYFRVAMLPVLMIPITVTTFTATFASSLDVFNICFGIAYGGHFVFEMFDFICISRLSYKDIYHKENKKIDNSDDGSKWALLCSMTRLKPAVLWAADHMFNKRRIRQPGQVKYLPMFDRRNPSKVVSRLGFLVFRTTRFVVFYVLLDFISVQLVENADVKFGPGKERLACRILGGELAPLEVVESIGAVLGFGVAGVMFLIGCHDLMSVLTVGSGLSDVAGWPPLFGPMIEAYSVRRFWGIFWHQELQIVVKNNSYFLAHSILRLPRRNEQHQTSRSKIAIFIVRYAKIQLAFVISGLLHLQLDLMQGIAFRESGVVAFFSLQALGILIEDLACAVYRWIRTGSAYRRENNENGERSPKPHLWVQCVGRLWVLLWMIYSAPVWIYPFLRRGPVSVVPITLFEKPS